MMINEWLTLINYCICFILIYSWYHRLSSAAGSLHILSVVLSLVDSTAGVESPLEIIKEDLRTLTDNIGSVQENLNKIKGVASLLGQEVCAKHHYCNKLFIRRKTFRHFNWNEWKSCLLDNIPRKICLEKKPTQNWKLMNTKT